MESYKDFRVWWQKSNKWNVKNFASAWNKYKNNPYDLVVPKKEKSKKPDEIIEDKKHSESDRVKTKQTPIELKFKKKDGSKVIVKGTEIEPIIEEPKTNSKYVESKESIQIEKQINSIIDTPKIETPSPEPNKEEEPEKTNSKFGDGTTEFIEEITNGVVTFGLNKFVMKDKILNVVDVKGTEFGLRTAKLVEYYFPNLDLSHPIWGMITATAGLVYIVGAKMPKQETKAETTAPEPEPKEEQTTPETTIDIEKNNEALNNVARPF